MFMSFNKVLQGFSLGCPWFKCVASLHRSITGLHPVDICFLNNCFFEFLAVLFSGYLFFTKRNSKSWVQQEFFFCACICEKVSLPIDNLHVAVSSFGKYAMNLNHFIGYDGFKSRWQIVSNNKDNRDYKLFVIFCCARM